MELVSSACSIRFSLDEREEDCSTSFPQKEIKFEEYCADAFNLKVKILPLENQQKLSLKAPPSTAKRFRIHAPENFIFPVSRKTHLGHEAGCIVFELIITFETNFLHSSFALCHVCDACSAENDDMTSALDTLYRCLMKLFRWWMHVNNSPTQKKMTN